MLDSVLSKIGVPPFVSVKPVQSKALPVPFQILMFTYVPSAPTAPR